MGCISKYGLITINFFVVWIGLVVMFFAAVTIYEQNKFHMGLTITCHAVPLTNLLTGIFLTLLGLLGCIAAITENFYMLTTYAVVAGFILVAVVISGIMLLVFTSTALMMLWMSMRHMFKEYGNHGNEALTHLLDELQHKGQCCGITGYEDRERLGGRSPYSITMDVADSCCKKWTEGCGVRMLNNPNVKELVWSKGCFDYVYFASGVIWVALAILSFILVSFQALSFTWACCLAWNSRPRSHYEQLYSPWARGQITTSFRRETL